MEAGLLCRTPLAIWCGRVSVVFFIIFRWDVIIWALIFRKRIVLGRRDFGAVGSSPILLIPRRRPNRSFFLALYTGKSLELRCLYGTWGRVLGEWLVFRQHLHETLGQLRCGFFLAHRSRYCRKDANRCLEALPILAALFLLTSMYDIRGNSCGVNYEAESLIEARKIRRTAKINQHLSLVGLYRLRQLGRNRLPRPVLSLQ